MTTSNITIKDLDFKEVKENLKDFLRSQSKFQDYDFEGSSMSILIDLLAYATHYNGYHAHMLNNESNIDSAYLRSSLTSKAKFHNYLPGSKKSARATVQVRFDVNSSNVPVDRKIVIPRGTVIRSNNNVADSRTFIVTDDVYIYNKSLVSGEYDYRSDEFLIYEGSFETRKFLVDSTLLNQRYIIADKDIDISTLRVRVYNSETDTSYKTFKLASDYMNIDGESLVYFLSTNEDGYYEIQFGNGVYGANLAHGNLVSCTYIRTGGESGNNAKKFTFGGAYSYKGTDYTATIDTISPSSGGLEAESIEDLRFNIPNHFRMQNRAVIADDYKSLLLSEYRNINSINVWGGEDNQPRAYGKVFICIKPRFGEVLSDKAKEELLSIIKKKSVTVIEAEIVDPDYLYVNLVVNVKYNPLGTNLSSGEIVSRINDAITEYNDVVLNRFGGFYSDTELNNRVRNTDKSILTSYTDITLEKRFEPTMETKQTYFVDFSNPLVAGTIKSGDFKFRLNRCRFVDDGKGNIHIYYYNVSNDRYELYEGETFGQVDYENGIVRLIDFEVNDLYDRSLTLPVQAISSKPDYFTKRNNIVSINDVVVNIEETFETENG